jgi:hypothetical protein
LIFLGSPHIIDLHHFRWRERDDMQLIHEGTPPPGLPACGMKGHQHPLLYLYTILAEDRPLDYGLQCPTSGARFVCAARDKRVTGRADRPKGKWPQVKLEDGRVVRDDGRVVTPGSARDHLMTVFVPPGLEPDPLSVETTTFAYLRPTKFQGGTSEEMGF